MNYDDIYVSVHSELPKQDWYTDDWSVTQTEDSITVYRDEWTQNEDLEIYFHSHGQGDDPEENPIILSINFGQALQDQDKKMEELEDRIQDELKPLIGWEMVHGTDVFARKELPSDPLTLQPRLLEEFKKLEPIAYRIDQMLGYIEN